MDTHTAPTKTISKNSPKSERTANTNFRATTADSPNSNTYATSRVNPSPTASTSRTSRSTRAMSSCWANWNAPSPSLATPPTPPPNACRETRTPPSSTPPPKSGSWRQRRRIVASTWRWRPPRQRSTASGCSAITRRRRRLKTASPNTPTTTTASPSSTSFSKQVREVFQPQPQRSVLALSQQQHRAPQEKPREPLQEGGHPQESRRARPTTVQKPQVREGTAPARSEGRLIWGAQLLVRVGEGGSGRFLYHWASEKEPSSSEPLGQT